MRPIPELLAPIPGENRAGANLEYESVYDEIKDARYQDPVNPELKSADWRRVIKLAEDALAEQTKDLQIAVWLTEALAHREGFAGFRQGIELLAGLIDGFWDDLYPPIEDGDVEVRLAPLNWLEDVSDRREQHFVPALRLVPLNKRNHDFTDYTDSRKVPTEREAAEDSKKQAERAALLAEKKVPPEDFEAGCAEAGKQFYKDLLADLEGCLEGLETLRKRGGEKAGKAAPGYAPVRTFLEEARDAVGGILKRRLEEDPDPAEPEPDVPDPLAPESAAEGSEGAAVPQTPRSWDEAGARLSDLARFLRSERPTDPAAYLMVRGFRWGELRAGGEEPDPRLLAAPPTEIRTRLKRLMLDGQWAELLEAGEKIMATPYGRAWLDLQRYVITACDALGADFAGVGTAIRAALRSLLDELPRLPTLSLMDDSPTANAETRTWLAEQRLVADGGDGSGEEQPPRRKEAAGLDERLVAQLSRSQPARAIELLMRAASQEQSERSRFLRRAHAARIMVQSGMEQVAMPILQELIDQIDRHALEDWEAGETVAEPLGLLYRCMERTNGDADARSGLYLRVCRLDPMQALSFERATESENAET